MSDKKRRKRILREMAASRHKAEAYLRAHPHYLLAHANLVGDMEKLTEAELFAALDAEYERIQAAGYVGNFRRGLGTFIGREL